MATYTELKEMANDTSLKARLIRLETLTDKEIIELINETNNSNIINKIILSRINKNKLYINNLIFQVCLNNEYINRLGLNIIGNYINNINIIDFKDIHDKVSFLNLIATFIRNKKANKKQILKIINYINFYFFKNSNINLIGCKNLIIKILDFLANEVEQTKTIIGLFNEFCEISENLIDDYILTTKRVTKEEREEINKFFNFN